MRAGEGPGEVDDDDPVERSGRGRGGWLHGRQRKGAALAPPRATTVSCRDDLAALPRAHACTRTRCASASTRRPRRLDPPFAVVDQQAFRANAADLVRRAAGTPVRVASKSVRVRSLLTEVLACDGWRGVMAFTLEEALWLVRTGVSDDVLVAYPSVDRAALAALCSDDALAAAVTLMVDDVAQLDLVDSVARAGRSPAAAGLPRARRVVAAARRPGARRRPALPGLDAGRRWPRWPRVVVARPGFALVGLMAYEAQIAGLGDAGRGPRSMAVRAMQRRSRARAGRAPGRGRRGRPGGRAARVRQRRRHRLAGEHGRRGRGHRGDRRVGAVRQRAVRPLPRLAPAARRPCSPCRWCAAPGRAW